MRQLLQINTVVNWGSTGRIAEDLGKLAIANKWQSTIAYGRGPGSSSSNLVRIGNDLDMYYHGFETRLLDNHGFSSRFATRRFISQIESLRPSVIHLHNLHGYYLNIELLFNYLAHADIPVVWTLHDCWSMTGHCCHFSYAQCFRWQSGCYNCPQKNTYPKSYFADRSAKNYALKRRLFTSVKNLTIVSVSEWLKNVVKQSFLKDHPVKVINNGLDLNSFRPYEESAICRKYGLKDKQIILGCANVWENQKGLKDFIRLRSHLNDNQYIVLVGLTRKQVKALPSGILGLTRTNSIEELSALYSAADVFLNLSREETFGIVTAEAMACGTPVVTYNTTASPELISEDTGRVVAPDDMKGILNAINEISSSNRETVSKACRNRAEKLYNKDDRFLEYIKTYDDILK